SARRSIKSKDDILSRRADINVSVGPDTDPLDIRHSSTSRRDERLVGLAGPIEPRHGLADPAGYEQVAVASEREFSDAVGARAGRTAGIEDARRGRTLPHRDVRDRKR